MNIAKEDFFDVSVAASGSTTPMPIRGRSPIRSSQGDRCPTLLLVGMRGAGKTTLGKLAAEHLKIPFIDADECFAQKFAPYSAKSFVAQHGWDAFRKAETEILKEILELAKGGNENASVISLGGGVVEEEINRSILREAWQGSSLKEGVDGLLEMSKNVAVVHIFREIDVVLNEPSSKGGRVAPAWVGAGTTEIWARRRPWLRSCSSHEFVNFTEASILENGDQAESSRQARLRFEAVERDFVRFLSRLVDSYQEEGMAKTVFDAAEQRSYLVTLPFTDLYPHVHHLRQLATGASAVELRADLLSDPSPLPRPGGVEAYENPSLSYLSEQVALVRRFLPDVPLVFTLRTPAQGGKYPYPANAPATALFASLHHALKLGAELIDVEQGLDNDMTSRLILDAKQRSIAVIVSWRDVRPPLDGGFSWGASYGGLESKGEDKAMKLYDRARDMGADVVKMVGTAGSTSDNFALRVFASRIDETRSECLAFKGKSDRVDVKLNGIPPLCAYNMGYKGRISRFLNPTLASVTHPLAKQLTREGTIGSPSMTFKEVQQALHLSGLTESRTYVTLLPDVLRTKLDRKMMREIALSNAWFEELGLPFEARAEGAGGLGEKLNWLLGREQSFMGFRIALEDWMQDPALLARVKLGRDAQATGLIDTVVIKKDPKGYKILHGENVLVIALVNLIRNALSPSIHLTRQSLAVIFATDKNAVSTRTTMRSLRRAGIGFVKVINPLTTTTERAFFEQGLVGAIVHPTIVIGVCDEVSKLSEAICRKIFSGPEGGLYIDLRPSSCSGVRFEDDDELSSQESNHETSEDPLAEMAQTDEMQAHGWRLLTSQHVLVETAAQRFSAWTGVRAPATMGDLASSITSSLSLSMASLWSH